MSTTIVQPPMDAETKSRLNSVPAWGSYLYQNFLLPAFSPTASMSEWLNLNTPFAALTPRGTAPATQQSTNGVQHPPKDYFGSAWGKDTEGLMSGSVAPTDNLAAANTMPFNFGHSQQQQPPPPPNPFANYSFAPQQPTAPAMQQSASYPMAGRSSESGPSSYYHQPSFPYGGNTSISTSLLMNQPPLSASSFALPPPHTAPSAMPYQHRPSIDRPSQPTSRNSLSIVDGQLTHTPSPMTSRTHTPHMSPKRAAKRRCDSLESDDQLEEHHDSEHEPDVPEGVERDGMIWGMKVDAYRALSARERKRVRNRISARTFRAKRKEHLSSLEENMNVKDLKLKLATEEAIRLKEEVAELKRRLAQYE